MKAVSDGSILILAEDDLLVEEKIKAFINEKNNEIYVELLEEDANGMNVRLLDKV